MNALDAMLTSDGSASQKAAFADLAASFVKLSPFSDKVGRREPHRIDDRDRKIAAHVGFHGLFADRVSDSIGDQLDAIRSANSDKPRHVQWSAGLAFYPLAMSRARLAAAAGPHAALCSDAPDVKTAAHRVTLSRAFVSLCESRVGFRLETGAPLSSHERLDLIRAEAELKKRDPDTHKFLSKSADDQVATNDSQLVRFAAESKRDADERSVDAWGSYRDVALKQAAQRQASAGAPAAKNRRALSGRER